jgi:type II secretory pathway pseudopilin PulG
MLKVLQKPFLKKAEVRSHKGLTLLETLLVLGLAAFVITGALSYFNTATNDQKVQSTNSAIASMSSGVKSLYRGQTNYSSLTTEIAIRSGKVPSNMIQSDTEIRNAWGGSVEFTGNSRDFEIELDSLDFEACVNMASAVRMTPTLVYGFQINSNAQINTPTVDPGVAMTDCSDTTLNQLTYFVR